MRAPHTPAPRRQGRAHRDPAEPRLRSRTRATRSTARRAAPRQIPPAPSRSLRVPGIGALRSPRSRATPRGSRPPGPVRRSLRARLQLRPLPTADAAVCPDAELPGKRGRTAAGNPSDLEACPRKRAKVQPVIAPASERVAPDEDAARATLQEVAEMPAPPLPIQPQSPAYGLAALPWLQAIGPAHAHPAMLAEWSSSRRHPELHDIPASHARLMGLELARDTGGEPIGVLRHEAILIGAAP